MYEEIIDRFEIPGKLKEVKPFGNGHVNDTLLLVYDTEAGEAKYVLQKINKYVFHHPDELMENFLGITAHLRKKIIAAGGDPERETLTCLFAKDGKPYTLDDKEDYWRITKFIDGTFSREIVEKPEDFAMTGKAFGHFQSQLSDYPAETLYYTIPDFHNTRARYQNFLKVLENCIPERKAQCKEEISFILGRKELAYYSMDSYERGELPIRVTHNDTKINNLLIDEKTGQAICVIDLDTVMPGFAMTDLGDAIRSGACTAVEDEPDLSKVHFDIGLFEAFTGGFIEGCDGTLTPHEIELLPMGALILTYEQALRFLQDYLIGDPYFKIAYPEHNLIRTHTQIRMVEEMEQQWDKMQAVMKRLR